MRWKDRQISLRRRCGEKETRHKFLWYPRKLDLEEWRWLEYADIIYKVQRDYNYKYQWIAVTFEDKK